MARGAEIDAFADKLRLLLGRANLSRAQLAQRVGVDKSVVARWLNGGLLPSDHSLTALTAAMARDVEGFSRTDWALDAAGFAARLGLAAARPAPAGTQPPPGVLLPGALARAGEHRDLTDRMYAGLWAMLFPAPTLGGRIYCAAARIWSPAGAPALYFEYANGVLLHNRGPAFALAGRLWVAMESLVHRDALASLFVHGVVDDTALILDGVLTGRRNTSAAALFAGRALLFRLSAESTEEGFAAVVERANALVRDGWERHLPPALQAAFARSGADGPNWLLMEAADAWTLGQWRLDDPASAARREALAHVRAAFAGVTGPLPG